MINENKYCPTLGQMFTRINFQHIYLSNNKKHKMRREIDGGCYINAIKMLINELDYQDKQPDWEWSKVRDVFYLKDKINDAHQRMFRRTRI